MIDHHSLSLVELPIYTALSHNCTLRFGHGQLL